MSSYHYKPVMPAMASKLKKELELENKNLKFQIEEYKKQIVDLNNKLEFAKQLIKSNQKNISNYNLYWKRIGISSSKEKLC